jgi:hypothetical protein
VPRTEATPVTVISVVGTPRSGSTILSKVLGELDGSVAVGELRALWWSLDRDRTRLCGCGERFLACPFWSDVLAAMGVDPTPGEVRRLAEVQAAAVRRRSPWRATGSVLRWDAGSMPPAARPFAELLAQTYRSIAAVSGSPVVVDSSKKSDFVALASALPGIDGLVVQTLRDVSAVVYSHYRRAGVEPGTSRPATAAARSASWLAESVSAARVRRQRLGSQLVRYEDFAAGPEAIVRDLAVAAGLGDSPLPFDDAGNAVVGTAHTVLGNQMRFRTGDLPIRPDDAWRSGLHPLDRAIATAVAAPAAVLVRRGSGRSRG